MQYCPNKSTAEEQRDVEQSINCIGKNINVANLLWFSPLNTYMASSTDTLQLTHI